MTAMTLLDAIHHRRAVRSYRLDPLGRESVMALLDAAVRAPTAMHREPWAFAVVQDREALKRHSDRAKALLLQQAAPEFAGLRKRLQDPGFNLFYDAGTLVVICRTLDSAFADADCWLAAENLMLAATAQGLGSCCIGLAVEWLNSAPARSELGIPDGATAVAPIIIGWPRGWPEPTSRQPPRILSWKA